MDKLLEMLAEREKARQENASWKDMLIIEGHVHSAIQRVMRHVYAYAFEYVRFI